MPQPTLPKPPQSPETPVQAAPSILASTAHVFLPFAPARPAYSGAGPLGVSPVSAEGSTAESPEYNEGYKLFVGCLPYEALEDDLRPLFEKFGQIIELSIQRDKSGFSKGCAWLRYTTRDSCEDCIRNLHNQYYLGSVRSAIQVKYAAPESSHTENRILLSGIPLQFSDNDVLTALSQYGEILEYIPSRAPGASSSNAAVKMARPDRAAALIASVRQGSMVIAGYPCFSLQAAFPPKPSPPTKQAVSVSVSSRTPTYFTNSSPSHSSAESFPLSQPLQPSVAASRFPRAPNIVTPSTDLPTDALTPCKLFVGCLPYSKTAQDLQDAFGQYGPILEVALLVNPDGKSKGAAFVTFARRQDALAAQQGLDGFTFPNSTRAINVSLATNQTWRAPQPPAPDTPTEGLRDLLTQMIGFDSPSPRAFGNVSGQLAKPPGFGSPASSPSNRRP